MPSGPLDRVPQVFGLRQTGVYPPDGLVEPTSHLVNIKIHDLVCPRPGTGSQRRPAGWSERRGDANHRPMEVALHELFEMGHVPQFTMLATNSMLAPSIPMTIAFLAGLFIFFRTLFKGCEI